MFRILHEAIRSVNPSDCIEIVASGVFIQMSRGTYESRKTEERLLLWSDINTTPGLILLAIEEMREGLTS